MLGVVFLRWLFLCFPIADRSGRAVYPKIAKSANSAKTQGFSAKSMPWGAKSYALPRPPPPLALPLPPHRRSLGTGIRRGGGLGEHGISHPKACSSQKTMSFYTFRTFRSSRVSRPPRAIGDWEAKEEPAEEDHTRHWISHPEACFSKKNNDFSHFSHVSLFSGQPPAPSDRR